MSRKAKPHEARQSADLPFSQSWHAYCSQRQTDRIAVYAGRTFTEYRRANGTVCVELHSRRQRVAAE